MKKINGLHATPNQTFSHSIDEGTIYFTLIYRPAVKMWFLDVEFNTFVLKGIRFCQSVNLLYQWHKIIPFGVSIDCIDNVEPFLINDFLSGRVIFNILNQSELQSVVDYYQEQKDLL